jgi:hypothetical protein
MQPRIVYLTINNFVLKYGIIIIISKRPDAVGSSPFSRNYKTGGICRQEGRPTNTGCQNTPTQHRLSNVTDS